MPEKDYSSRTVVDKLGIKQGHAVALESTAWPIDDTLQQQIRAQTGRSFAGDAEVLDSILVAVDAATDAAAVLTLWKKRLHPAGGIWLLTPKRQYPGYVDQRELLAAGQQAGLVDNKVCSISDTVSAMRFVIRKRDRES